MSTRADDLIDRRRLRRKLTFWRVVAFLILALAILSATRWLFDETFGVGDHIAQLRIEGTITEDDDVIDLIDDLRTARQVKGVIVTVDSPGGTTTGGEAIFEAIRRLAEDKPVVAQVGTLAASAGYMIASATDYIVARQTSIVGSIGVLIEYPDVTELMDRIGVKMEAVKSSPLKAEPSPFTPTSPEARQMLAAMIRDSYDWFVDLVAERRKLPREEAVKLSDGSIFTGRQALERKLVDQLGGKREAQAWLESQGVPGNLQIVEWKPKDSDREFFLPRFAADWVASRLGLPREGDLLRRLGAERIFLDGLLSLWQPVTTGRPE